MMGVTFSDIRDEVYMLDEFRVIGSDIPKLSYPVLKYKEGVLYCVFMVYEGLFETIPDYYVITPLPKLSPRVLKPAEAMEFLGMPDSVVFGDADEDEFLLSMSEDDLFDRFDECIAGDEPDKERYNDYVDALKECVLPEAVRFYEFFKMK